MEDHRNLSEIYAAYRIKVVEYLQKKHGAVPLESKNKVKYPISLSINFKVAEIDIALILNIPFNFPDAFPQTKLDEVTFKKVSPIPHLDAFRTLCLFDDVLASPNPQSPTGVIDAVIDKAEEVLRKGILGLNSADFLEEFESYWMQECEKEKNLNLVIPTEGIKLIYLVPCVSKTKEIYNIFADSVGEAINWVQNIGDSYNDELITKALYIPLTKPLSFPYPQNNREVHRMLTKEQGLNLKIFYSYLNHMARPSKILFSVEGIDKSYTWGIWEHQKPFKQRVLIYKGRKVTDKSLKGYRKNSKNSQLELVRDFPKNKIKKYFIQDVRSSRLKSRGGDGDLKHQSRKVVIIGCGSVGSHLTQSLFDIGVQNLLLIDPETLNFENINRHLCGASQVGLKKTDAVKNQIKRHYPSSQVDTCSMNVLSFLSLYPAGLNSYDLIISAIGHMPTELRLNDLQRSGSLTPSILNVWVEPYLTAGHAIWTESGSEENLNEIFNNGKYKYQVLKNGSQYSKKELGCNTSFVPYGNLELKKFIYDVALFIHQRWDADQRDDLILTWLGNLSAQRKYKRRLEPLWVGASDFSVKHWKLKNKHET